MPSLGDMTSIVTPSPAAVLSDLITQTVIGEMDVVTSLPIVITHHSKCGSGLYGQLQATDDPNSARNLFSYDAFGRLKRIAKPGDTLTHPTEEYFYYDTNTPFFMQRLMRKVAGAGVNPWNDGNGSWWTTLGGLDLNALAI